MTVCDLHCIAKTLKSINDNKRNAFTKQKECESISQFRISKVELFLLFIFSYYVFICYSMWIVA